MQDNRAFSFMGGGEPGATGCHETPQRSRIVEYPIGRFVVTVRVDEDNRLLGVEEIRINKDFIDFQKKSAMGFHDVDEYYRE